MNDTPSAFSVAHYMLLFIVATLCTVLVIWVLITANNREASINDKIIIQHSQSNKICQRTTADKTTAIWQNTPQKIPEQYIQMEHNYANRIVSVRTTGNCNGRKFVCQMGEVRSACDPCAKNSARKRAMFQHISDTIDQTCKKI